MSKITLNPSIATVLDIDPIALNERVNVYLTADENWTGEFEFVVYNSAVKNRFVKPANALTVVEKRMTLVIEPIVQGLTATANYYEIVSTSTKRIVFKGLLNITK
ncbi:hypothetical protein [Flavobacterium sp. IMCC34518]|uniref:hypothetical protein n=1 Tax=Flavobacterium sp. IMCC34518 TaxID=3003623 RepID=UPI0022AC18C7|nr:hypothetical protein [Flavobacterium sp. IMCC34518]